MSSHSAAITLYSLFESEKIWRIRSKSVTSSYGFVTLINLYDNSISCVKSYQSKCTVMSCSRQTSRASSRYIKRDIIFITLYMSKIGLVLHDFPLNTAIVSNHWEHNPDSLRSGAEAPARISALALAIDRFTNWPERPTSTFLFVRFDHGAFLVRRNCFIKARAASVSMVLSHRPDLNSVRVCTDI